MRMLSKINQFQLGNLLQDFAYFINSSTTVAKAFIQAIEPGIESSKVYAETVLLKTPSTHRVLKIKANEKVFYVFFHLKGRTSCFNSFDLKLETRKICFSDSSLEYVQVEGWKILSLFKFISHLETILSKDKVEIFQTKKWERKDKPSELEKDFWFVIKWLKKESKKIKV